MKLWKYKHYDGKLRLIPIDKPIKDIEVWSETQPDEDYIEVLGEEFASKLILKDSENYPQRRIDGIWYSDIMNAKLNLMTIEGASEEIVEAAKDEIDTAFAPTQLFLEGGKWKSAQREITKVSVSLFVDQELIDEIKIYIDAYVAHSY